MGLFRTGSAHCPCAMVSSAEEEPVQSTAKKTTQNQTKADAAFSGS